MLGPPLGRAPVILLYHRVAAPVCDPWGLAVSPARFREQMAWLKATRTILSMDELVGLLETRAVPPGAAAVTFDDGYADNAQVAAPILQELAIPATIFLTTGAVRTGQPFWWDELVELVFAHDGESKVVVHGTQVEWQADRAPAERLREWRAGEPAPESRCAAYLALWTLLQRLDPDARELAMQQLREQVPAGKGTDVGRPMTEALVRSLPSCATVGGHGRTHVPLPQLAPAERESEIAGGRADVTRLTGGGPPRGFAYPHGAWDAATREEVVAAGYDWAVAVGSRCIDPRRFDRYALPRVAVEDWPPDRLEQKILDADW